MKEQSTKAKKSGRINKKQKRKKEMKYSKEFKEEALKLSDEIGVKKASRQLGIYFTADSELSESVILFLYF